MTHICVSEIIIIGSDNGLSPGRRQAIIWTNAGILLIGPLGIHFSEILIEFNTVSFNKMHLKMSSTKWRLFRLGLNVLNLHGAHISFLILAKNRESSWCQLFRHWCRQWRTKLAPRGLQIYIFFDWSNLALGYGTWQRIEHRKFGSELYVSVFELANALCV